MELSRGWYKPSIKLLHSIAIVLLAPEAYKLFDEKSDGMIKVVLKTAFAAVQQAATGTH